jgi:hypothetical protein
MLATLALAAPAGAASTWRQIADGTTTGSPVTTTSAYVALSPTDVGAFSAHLGADASRLSHVRWATTAVVAVLADWGCSDSLVSVGGISEKGGALHVRLVHEEPPPGTAICQALYGVYRLLTVPKSTLHKPYPTHAAIDVA